jgi:hypothetical protein
LSNAYGFETSYAYLNNSIGQLFDVLNFTLGMALFFGLYFPFGNWVVGLIYKRFSTN